MGWNARLKSGFVLSQKDGISFTEVNLHDIEEMWLDGLESVSIHKRCCPGFVEFLQFETAVSSPDGPKKMGEYIGWTNGRVSFLLGISREKKNFHPMSRVP